MKASGGWESVEGVEEDRESSLALVHNGAERTGQGGGGSNGGGRSLPGRHVPDTRRPLKHKREHLAGDGMASVGRRFGPDVDRIWAWTKNEVCRTLDTLQL